MTPMGALALVTAAISAVLLLHQLVVRPALTLSTRLKLLLGLAVFPFVTAVASTAHGMHRTTERDFCGSCHVMTTHLGDLEDPKSASLASRHGRNPMFGGTACYTCHADYSMLGYPLTKLTGMSHVFNYYLGGYKNWSLERFHAEVRIAKPFPNSNCRQCHSAALASFQGVEEHRAIAEELTSERVSCASAGCHGVAHPFSKRPEEL
ncbi:MAG: NapC/NirT family cytochrome c [Myxococcaceae bacterium]|nr:NapC/NirT family cytochrome c [Myxococcaceae bacterium]